MERHAVNAGRAMNQTAQGNVGSASIDRKGWLAIIALVAFGVFLLGHLSNRFPTDFSALYMAGHFYSIGEYDLIYDAPDGFFGNSPPLWDPFLPALGIQGQPVVPYVYPPIWAALLAPFTEGVDAWSVFRVAAIVKITALLGSVIISWRICQTFAVSLWVWVLTSILLLGSSTITLTALYYLQPQIVVIFLVLLAFERYARGTFLVAGMILGVAAAMKIAPAGLVLIFLLDRNWRAVAGFVASGAVLAMLSFIIAGIELNLAFLDAMAAASAGTLITSINYSVNVILYGLTHPIDWTARNIIVETPFWTGLLSKGIGAAGLVWAILKTKDMGDDKRLVTRIILFGLLMNLFGPLSWAHYFLLQLFLLPAILTLMPAKAGFRTVALTGIATSWVALMIYRTWLPGDFPVAMIFTAAFVALFVALIRKAHA